MAATVTVQVDDFDPLVVYPNPGQWLTPNPQDHPSWFNETKDVTGSIWHQATYHATTEQGAEFKLDFTGTALKVYGAKGPAYGNFSISLDAGVQNPFTQSFSAYAAENATEPQVLYETDQLAFGAHSLTVTNMGSGVLVDLIEFTVPVGGAGATLTNTTWDETDPQITYSDGWESNSDPLFYGGTSIYASNPGAELSFNFSGSALYIYGDQVNDHGEYSVYYNDSQTPVRTLTGRSGCNGENTKYCEKLGGLHFFDAPLPQGTHRVRLVNGGSQDVKTFVDIDRIVYTTPSVYTTIPKVNSTCPFTNCDAGANPSASGSASASVSGASSAASGTPSGSASRPEAVGGGLLLAVWAFRMFGW